MPATSYQIKEILEMVKWHRVAATFYSLVKGRTNKNYLPANAKLQVYILVQVIP